MIINRVVWKYFQGVASVATRLGAPDVVVEARPYHMRFLTTDDFDDAEFVLSVDADVRRGGRVATSAVAAPAAEVARALEEVGHPLRISLDDGTIRFSGPHGATEVRGRAVALPREVHVGGFSSISELAKMWIDIEELKNALNQINTEEVYIYFEKDRNYYDLYVTNENYEGTRLRNSAVEAVQRHRSSNEGHYSTIILKAIMSAFDMRGGLHAAFFEKKRSREMIPDIIEPYPPLILQGYWRCFRECQGIWGVYFEVNSHYAPLPPLPYF